MVQSVVPTHSVITGGASGIGEAVAAALAQRGHRVSVFDMSVGEAAGVHFEQVDLTDEAAVSAAFERVVERSGRVTNLVTSAGIRGEYLPALELDVEQTRRVLDVNILGTFIPAREMVRRLNGEPGSIVALSSTTAYGGWPQQADYGTSKAAVRSLVEHLAIEWAPLAVRVNAVAPGHTLTPLVQSMVGEGFDLSPVRERTPLGRLADPREMAGVIAALLVDSSHVTGQCLPVDGGWTVAGK